jgi:hypothetical protein
MHKNTTTELLFALSPDLIEIARTILHLYTLLNYQRTCASINMTTGSHGKMCAKSVLKCY